MKLPPGINESSLTDLLLDAVCVVDADGKFRFISAAGERIFGYSPQEMVGRAVLDLVLPADRERTRAAGAAVMDGRSHLDFENRYLRKDGSIVHVMWSARWCEAERVRVAVARDVTRLKRTQAMHAALYAISEAANASEDLAALFRRSHDIVGGLLPMSGFAVALQEAPGTPLQLAYHAGDTRHKEQVSALCARVWRAGEALTETAHGRVVLAVPLVAGQLRLGVLALLNAGGAHAYGDEERDLMSFVASQLGAVVQRKQLQTRMQFMALHDDLTGLPNRRLFHDRLDTALARAHRMHSRLALLFIDLNRFKQVNDLHGHQAGDRLLEQVARRLAASVRDTDTLARLGGDEFVVLLENVALPGDVGQVADKIRLALGAPVDLGGGLVLETSASIGIAHYPENGDSVQALMARADEEMYRVKQAQAAGCAAS